MNLGLKVDDLEDKAFVDHGVTRQSLLEVLRDVRGSQRVTSQSPESTYELELEDNVWWCIANRDIIPTGDASAFGARGGKNHHDAVRIAIREGVNFIASRTPAQFYRH